MKIAQLVALEEPVPPRKYGGTELVVYNLIEEQVALGHEVYLLGTGDSKTSAHLIPIMDQSIRTLPKKRRTGEWRDFWKIKHVATFLTQIKKLKPDIVHNHFNWRIVQFSNLIDCPVYSTLHGPLASLRERETYTEFPHHNYVSISANQRKAMPGLNWIGTVYNGIDVSAFEMGPPKRDYFAFLGRTSPEKGLKEIIQTVLKTPFKLKIAAKVDTVDRDYFNQEIKPLIDGDQIEFLGEIDHQEKVQFLKHAKALLLWLNWEEPFGLVVIEAFASGTPVIVNPRGSMPELIKDGQTGYLVNSLDQMQARLHQVDQLDQKLCRKEAQTRFSRHRMAKDYLRLAQQIISHS